MKHILFFARNGTLSYESMMNAHRALGFQDGAILKLKLQAILNFAKSEGKNDELVESVSKFARELESMHNPCALGIWKVGGKIDYDRLDEICHLAVDGVLSRDAIHKYRTSRSSVWALSTVVWWYGIFPVPITWGKVTDGSLDELFTLVGDGNSISVQDFREFYEHNDTVLLRIMRKE
jgi:hypothetical protein